MIWCDRHSTWSSNCGCNLVARVKVERKWSSTDVFWMVFFACVLAYAIGQGAS